MINEPEAVHRRHPWPLIDFTTDQEQQNSCDERVRIDTRTSFPARNRLHSRSGTADIFLSHYCTNNSSTQAQILYVNYLCNRNTALFPCLSSQTTMIIFNLGLQVAILIITTPFLDGQEVFIGSITADDLIMSFRIVFCSVLLHNVR